MLKAGARAVEITPKCEINLAGSFEVRRTSKVNDPLFSTSTVIESDEGKLAFISCDLLFLSDEQNDELRERISKKTKIPSSNIQICCTHTHNGPSMFPMFPFLPVDKKVVKDVMERIVESAELAAGKMQPARMGYCRGSAAKATFNRRFVMSDGRSFMHPEKRGPDPDRVGPEGPADPDVQVIWFEDLKGNYIGILVNFSAHATTNFNEPVISADFPGAMRQVIQAVMGDVPVLYLQGACGNTSPVNQEDERVICKGLEGARRIGRILGGEVIKLLAENYPRQKDSLNIALEERSLLIPIRKPSAEEVERAKKELNESPRTEKDYTDMWAMANYYYNYWAVELSEGRSSREEYPLRTSIISLDDIAMVTNSAELFVEYQLDIKRRSPYPNTMVVELTNGYCGYVLTKLALAMGSYEARTAFSSKLVPEAGSALVETALEILNKMKVRRLK